MSVEFPWPDDLTPQELQAVCENPAFRALCLFCQGQRQHWPRGGAHVHRRAFFDADELGIDPEDDYELFEEE